MNKLSHAILIYGVLCLQSLRLEGQNPLIIPPTLSGDTFNLEIQQGVTQFYPGINTPTYGINGALLAPTLIFNKWDTVLLNVKNSLKGNGNSTTIHWHGLHVPAKYDGGPHQIILQNSIWSPKFRVLNNAGTFWYHPHGQGKTDAHVSKGLAGMIIIKDSAEAALALPGTYGVDDFPIIAQTKAFDVLNQIAISTGMDTAVMVNGVINPYLNAPAQVIRFRLLNGSSGRSFLFGLSNNMDFHMIATDGGLLDSAIRLNRLLLSNGERAEILIDLSQMKDDTISLICYGSELNKGIMGADSVGDANNAAHDYYDNPLNGADYKLLQINVGAPTSTPITTIPKSLAKVPRFDISKVSKFRHIFFDTLSEIAITPNLAEGPFGMNRKFFNMDSVNELVHLGATEIWTLHNKTMVAHPFHIHDIQFNILGVNGKPVPPYQNGNKDVVLVMPGDSVRFITKFENFADDMVPYMYHCHLLHHEDDGMMGSFLVLDTNSTGINKVEHKKTVSVYPNPASGYVQIKSDYDLSDAEIQIVNSVGIQYYRDKNVKSIISVANFPSGVYFIRIEQNNNLITSKIIIK